MKCEPHRPEAPTPVPRAEPGIQGDRDPGCEEWQAQTVAQGSLAVWS